MKWKNTERRRFPAGKRLKSTGEVNSMKKKLNFDHEENEIISAYESGNYRSLPDQSKLKKKYVSYARSASEKDKRINIRLAGNDFEH